MDWIFFRELHSGIRWIIVLIGVIALIKYLIGYFGKGEHTKLDQQLLGAFGGVVAIQFLLGLVLFFWRYLSGDPFSISTGSIFAHLLTMLLTLGATGSTSARTRRAVGNAQKFQTGLIGLVASAALIFVGVWFVQGW